MNVARSVLLFLVAGLCEIGGGYLVWRWWRNGAPPAVGVVGALLLVLYGIVPTYQPAGFGRVYAAYGGWFVVLSLLWGWGIDGIAPDGLGNQIGSQGGECRRTCKNPSTTRVLL